MTIPGAVAIVAEAEAGSSNFLIPNGTFFFILAIFLVVFGVISRFVVKPVQKVIDERERFIAQTAKDNRQAAEQDAAADSAYADELAAARAEAGAVRDKARSEGRAEVDGRRAEASSEVSDKLRQSGEALQAQGDVLAPELNASVDALANTLADRILLGEASDEKPGR